MTVDAEARKARQQLAQVEEVHQRAYASWRRRRSTVSHDHRPGRHVHAPPRVRVVKGYRVDGADLSSRPHSPAFTSGRRHDNETIPVCRAAGSMARGSST